MTTPCEHHYEYAGLRYIDGEHNLPGTSARPRYYAHVYFCTKCREKQSDTVETTHTSYDEPVSGSLPGSKGEVPIRGNNYNPW